MTEVLGPWRATYTPGEWVVLSGPTSMVVLQPASGELSALVSSIWKGVLASSSILDLAGRLTAFGLDVMPSLGAFFWTPDGMRSLVRGVVTVTDAATGAVVADGAGMQTWREVGHGGLDRVRVVMQQPSPGLQLELPLLVGVVRASTVVLDASPMGRVSSAQGLPDSAFGAAGTASESEIDSEGATKPETVVDQPAEAQVDEVEWGRWGQQADVVPDDDDNPVVEGGADDDGSDDDRADDDRADTELMVLGAGLIGTGFTATEPMAAGVLTSEPQVLASFCGTGHTNAPGATACRLCDSPIAPGAPHWAPAPTLATLTNPGAEAVDLDRAVLIGRAPSASRADAGEPRLMTVQSPSHDISRTHVQVAPENWQIIVTDLQSTNGTVLVSPGADPSSLRLTPGVGALAPVGSRIELGDGVTVCIESPQ